MVKKKPASKNRIKTKLVNGDIEIELVHGDEKVRNPNPTKRKRKKEFQKTFIPPFLEDFPHFYQSISIEEKESRIEFFKGLLIKKIDPYQNHSLNKRVRSAIELIIILIGLGKDFDAGDEEAGKLLVNVLTAKEGVGTGPIGKKQFAVYQLIQWTKGKLKELDGKVFFDKKEKLKDIISHAKEFNNLGPYSSLFDEIFPRNSYPSRSEFIPAFIEASKHTERLGKYSLEIRIVASLMKKSVEAIKKAFFRKNRKNLRKSSPNLLR